MKTLDLQEEQFGDGLVHNNLLASYTHLRDAGGNHWTRRFVAHVQACRDGAAGRTAKC